MLSQNEKIENVKEELLHIAERTELISELSMIARWLLDDKFYTNEHAAEDLVKLINEQMEFISKIG
ncbi:hypothetical protein COD86_15855 [Bacillus cereus]|nr:hypothetical protein COD14_01000 [Bacillus cereus]PGV94366.1 hypothetical protein COD86_15855 [Bacillus cereus]